MPNREHFDQNLGIIEATITIKTPRNFIKGLAHYKDEQCSLRESKQTRKLPLRELETRCLTGPITQIEESSSRRY